MCVSPVFHCSPPFGEITVIEGVGDSSVIVNKTVVLLVKFYAFAVIVMEYAPTEAEEPTVIVIGVRHGSPDVQ